MASSAAEHLVVGGAGAGEADVLEDRAVEQEPLLGHDDDPLAQRPLGGVAEVDAGVAHGALGGVVEPGDELGQGGLAGAGGADEREALADRDVEVDVARAPAGPSA